LPELIVRPRVSYQSWCSSVEYSLPSTSITWTIGRPYFFAKAKSRSSWPGTAINAPSP
jgi:hypothetical protein